jgi:hypothetical protein
MACRITNLTKEEIMNSMKNGDFIMQPLLNQTQEETHSRLTELSRVTKLEDTGHKYFLFGDIPIKESVSEKAKRKVGLRSTSITPDNDIQRRGGTFIHSVMRDLLDHLVNEKGTLDDIRGKAIHGDVKMDFKQFEQLRKLALRTKDEINKIQERIDPKGKVNIYLEQPMVDFMANEAGTVDVMAVFSDNTGAIYDYKTSGKGGSIGLGEHGKEVKNNLLPYYDSRAYDLSMTDYKRIALERLGIKTIRQNRLLPIGVEYSYKATSDRTEGSKFKPEFQTVLAVDDTNPYLKPIPTGGEPSRWEGITKLIEGQYRTINTLSERLSKAKSTDEKENIKRRIDTIEKSINKTLVDEDINDLIQTISNLSTEANTRLIEPKTNDDNSPNPAYLNDGDLDNYKKEMSVYQDIFSNTHDYFRDIEEENPELFDKLQKDLFKMKPAFDQILDKLNYESNNRIMSIVDKEFRDETGEHLLPFEELSFSQLQFLKMSEINSPIFRTAWKLIEEAQFKTKQKFTEMDEKVYKITEDVFKWAKDNNLSRADAWKILVNEKTGNMYAKLDKSFNEKFRKAISDKDQKGIEFIKGNYEFKNKEAWQKEYKERLESQKAIIKANHNNLEATTDSNGKIIVSAKKQKESYENRLESWITSNNLAGSNAAWLNEYNVRRYLKVKDESLASNYSEEYKRIRNIKPLHDFYETSNEYMEEFASIFGISDQRELPSNFIPNVRKETLEHLTRDVFHPIAALKEMMDAFKVREEDIYLARTDENGISRQIPILFKNPFYGKDGKVDLTAKSYDLSSALMTFGKMAYNYEHMSQIEPTINSLKSLLGNPSPEQGGMQTRDRLGRKIKGKIEPFLTK